MWSQASSSAACSQTLCASEPHTRCIEQAALNAPPVLLRLETRSLLDRRLLIGLEEFVTPRPVSRVLTIVMDILVVLAVCLTIGVVVRFFGALGNTQVGESIYALSR